PHGLSVLVIPVAVVRGLPVALKRLSYGMDTRQPLDGRHSVVTGNDCAHGIAMILRKVTAIHLVGDQYLLLDCFVSGETSRIRDRTGRYRLLYRRPPIGSFEHDLTSVLFHAGPLPPSSHRHTGPFRIAGCAELPLRSFARGGEEAAAV